MYLTRFRINTARLHARRILASPQILHAAVLSSFSEPPAPRSEDGRVLWRVDRKNRAETYLYIVSPDKPDLTHLVEQAGWPVTGGGWETHDYSPFLARLTKGEMWAFRLTANPVHTVRRDNGEPTKPTAHVGPRHQQAWLLERQEAAGFTVVEKPEDRQRIRGVDTHELVVHDKRQLEFRKNGQRNPVTLTTVTFDGRLEITDPDALRRTLTHGLGRAKGYGCGLLTLARA